MSTGTARAPRVTALAAASLLALTGAAGLASAPAHAGSAPAVAKEKTTFTYTCRTSDGGSAETWTADIDIFTTKTAIAGQTVPGQEVYIGAKSSVHAADVLREKYAPDRYEVSKHLEYSVGDSTTTGTVGDDGGYPFPEKGEPLTSSKYDGGGSVKAPEKPGTYNLSVGKLAIDLTLWKGKESTELTVDCTPASGEDTTVRTIEVLPAGPLPQDDFAYTCRSTDGRLNGSWTTIVSLDLPETATAGSSHKAPTFFVNARAAVELTDKIRAEYKPSKVRGTPHLTYTIGDQTYTATSKESFETYPPSGDSIVAGGGSGHGERWTAPSTPGVAYVRAGALQIDLTLRDGNGRDTDIGATCTPPGNDKNVIAYLLVTGDDDQPSATPARPSTGPAADDSAKPMGPRVDTGVVAGDDSGSGTAALGLLAVGVVGAGGVLARRRLRK